MSQLLLIDPELWAKTRAGARTGRGFRFQDAVGAWMAVQAWQGSNWETVIPEGVDDVTLHGPAREYRVQIKSRHDPQASFSLQEVATHLAKSAANLPDGWDKNDAVHIGLVLERRADDLKDTGWQKSIADAGQSLDVLSELLDKTLKAPHELVRKLLERSHIIVTQEPLDDAVLCIEEHSHLPAAAARIVAQKLREAAGIAADENYAANPDHPKTLGATDVQRQIDTAHGIIDPAGYLALTKGLCEIANFAEPLSSSDFYLGVDVLPGHVGAGLVFKRPTPMAEVLEALERERAVLISGPSGAGKSALAWLAAYHTRHAVRWYRVRHLRHEDVASLVQLVHLLEGTPERPIAFVVDDVGRENTSGWDELAFEAKAHAGIMLLGTIREEDLFTLETATKTRVVRPTLDEDLAERIWRALWHAKSTKLGHWREAFEISQSLLLEYTHLLTEGQRLEETIRDQVKRRLLEKRDDELVLLRTVAFASANGAAIDQARVREKLGWDSPRFARALVRLIDEHAIRERPDGALTGLHEIRSVYIDGAIRELLGDPPETPLKDAVRCLRSADFATFNVKVLRRWPELHVPLIKALSERVADSDLSCWAPILDGLGLATADMIAERWVEITRAIQIDDQFSSFVFLLASGGAPLDIPNPAFVKAKEAQEKFSAVQVLDLRWSLTDCFSASPTLPTIGLQRFHELVATLLPLKGCPTGPELIFTPDADLSQLPLIPLLELLRTARELSLDYAVQLVESAGGTRSLLDKLHHELPWVMPALVSRVDGVTSVSGDVRFISGEVQQDINAEVAKYCELMSAACPEAETVSSSAVFADGTPARLGDFQIAVKKIQRRHLAAPARVAWNRAQLRAVQRLVGAKRETDRSTALAAAIDDAANQLQEAAELYCRMDAPNTRWQMLVRIRGWMTELVPPPSVDEHVPNALSAGNYADSDKVRNLADGLQSLIVELSEGKDEKPQLMAARVADLARDAEGLTNPNMWRLAEHPPIGALNRIKTVLWDVRAVLGDVANNFDRRRQIAVWLSKTSRRHAALPRAAKAARERAASASAERSGALEDTFAAAGMPIKVFSRPAPKDSGLIWPDVEYAALFLTDSVVEWFVSIERFILTIRSAALNQRICYAPVMRGRLPPFAITVAQTPLPYLTLGDDWASFIPYPCLTDSVLTKLDSAIDALATLSTIMNCRERALNEAEQAYVDKLIGRFSSAADWFLSEFQQNPNEALITAANFLNDCAERVKTEAASPPDGDTLGAQIHKSIEGGATEFGTSLITLRIVLAEWALGKRDECVPDESTDSDTG